MMLFEALAIKGLELKNRLVMPALRTSLATDRGEVTQRLIDHYVERARGGVGLIIVEDTCVDFQMGRSGRCQLRIDAEEALPGLRRLAQEVHRHGTKIALQLHHAGRRSSSQYTGGKQIVGPSSIPSPAPGSEVPRPLDVAEIKGLVEAFAQAAERARQAGFDAVEVHGGHHYLINQFLSPTANHRTDEYGGPQGRPRFALEIVQAIRQRVGQDFPVFFRASMDECVEGGLKVGDMIPICLQLQEAGVDAFHASAAGRDAEEWGVPPMGAPPNLLVPLAHQLRMAVRVPVIAVGKINDPRSAERVLVEGKADLVAMGRALIADPYLPRKAQEGLWDDVRPCTACNQSCLRVVTQDQPIACTVNAAAGREAECVLEPAKRPRRIWVVGGGPAGMECARVAASRGHAVTLWEKEDRLGGQLNLAVIPPGKEELGKVTQYLRGQLDKLGVEVRLKQEGTPAQIEEAKPDVVVVATGASPGVGSIPAAPGGSVFSYDDVLQGKADPGGPLVVVGGGRVGCETADFLAHKGKRVSIVEMQPELAPDLEGMPRRILLRRLREQNVESIVSSRVTSVSARGVVIKGPEGERELAAEGVVLALGSQPERHLVSTLMGKGWELHTIGDCNRPRDLGEAIREGFDLAARL